MQRDPALLSVNNLQLAFRTEQDQYVNVLNNVNFIVPYNTNVALVGESGSGKSVTALSIMRLLPAPPKVHMAAESQIVFDGQDLFALSSREYRRLRGKDIAMIFQEPMSSLNPVFTVGEQIAEAISLHIGLSRTARRQRVLDLLTQVGLSDPDQQACAYPHQLSGGQQQRVMIAMAIACQPKLLIADEPTTALDVTIQRQILQLIAQVQRAQGMSVLMITHDLALAAEFADHVVVMQEGEVREAGTCQDIFNRPKHRYTRALLACRPRLDYRPPRLPVVDDFMKQEEVGRFSEITQPEITQRLRGSQPHDEIILDVQQLSKTFVTRDGILSYHTVDAVKEVSFTVARGKTLGVVGESGSGKTTLGLMLVRLCQATSGRVVFYGTDILNLTARQFAAYKRRIQIIFQNPYASLNPRFTVAQILCEPMQLHHIGKDASERYKLARVLLDKVGLASTSLHKYPHQFSGGQRQRLAIARSLTLKPDILICDEAVSALDVSVQAQILNLLHDLQDEYQLTYLFISHDLAVIKHISDCVLVMYQGAVVEHGNVDDIYAYPSHPYTHQLLQAIPKIKCHDL